MKAHLVSCKVCSKASAGMFCALEDDLLAKLDAGKTVQRFESGQALFYEGTAPLAVFSLQSGLVKLVKSTPDGHSAVIRLLGHGDIAGFRAVVADEVYAAAAEVVEPADVCIIPAPLFRELLAESSSFKTALILKLAAELRISEERMLDQAFLPARVRVARLLLFLAEKSSSKPGGTVIHTRLHRQDLAEAVGVTPQTLSRILHQFNTEGMVKASRTRISILAPQRLRAAAALDS